MRREELENVCSVMACKALIMCGDLIRIRSMFLQGSGVDDLTDCRWEISVAGWVLKDLRLLLVCGFSVRNFEHVGSFRCVF